MLFLFSKKKIPRYATATFAGRELSLGSLEMEEVVLQCCWKGATARVGLEHGSTSLSETRELLKLLLRKGQESAVCTGWWTQEGRTNCMKLPGQFPLAPPNLP